MMTLITLNQAQAISFEPLVLWNKSKLSFCFYNGPKDLDKTILVNSRIALKKFKVEVATLKTSDKNFLKKLIESEFTKDSTGIHFEQINDCKKADLVILKNKKRSVFNKKRHYGQASIGESGIITSEGPSFFKKKSGFYGKSGHRAYIALATVDRATTIHELGHVAGLRHEHARDEAYEDSNCSKENAPSQGNSSSLRESLYVTTDISNYYDSFSVMNYCYVNWNRESINQYARHALSDQDKTELKAIYQDR
jgi:hypothetical protein